MRTHIQKLKEYPKICAANGVTIRSLYGLSLKYLANSRLAKLTEADIELIDPDYAKLRVMAGLVFTMTVRARYDDNSCYDKHGRDIHRSVNKGILLPALKG